MFWRNTICSLDVGVKLFYTDNASSIVSDNIIKIVYETAKYHVIVLFLYHC